MSRTRRHRASRDRVLGGNRTYAHWNRITLTFEQYVYVVHPPVKGRPARQPEKRWHVGEIKQSRASVRDECERQSYWSHGLSWLRGTV